MAPKRANLVRCRKNLGFTQEALADELGVERSTVQRWESGDREPQPWHRPRLAKALRVSAQQLDQMLDEGHTDTATPVAVTAHWVSGHRPHDFEHALVGPGPRNLAEIDDMQRREALRLFSMVGTMLALPAGPSPGTAASRPRAIGVAAYGQLNGHLWQVYALASSKAEVLPLVRRQLTVLTEGLAEPEGTDNHQRLCALAGDLFQLAGEIYFDANAYTDAAHCYSLAAHASKEAGAYDLWACAMTRHAYLSVYDRKFSDAVPMLDLAAALARRGDSSLSTRHWVAAVQAEAYAGLGDLNACQRALDTAEQVQSLPGMVHNGGWLRFDGARLAEERGTCYATLGRVDLAETALADALQQTLSPRRRAGVLTDLAMIGAQRRDPDRVITYADEALAEARESGSGMVGRKLLGLQRHLPPLLANKQIQRLDSEITALTSTNAS
jgi:transcriptional regulator with XRE-family HTH domain